MNTSGTLSEVFFLREVGLHNSEITDPTAAFAITMDAKHCKERWSGTKVFFC